MSVRTWKRIITFTVLAIILGLTVSTVCLGVRVTNLNQQIITLMQPVEIEETAEPPVLLLPYQQEYPDLYVKNDFVFESVDEKTCYLTFDDGPSAANTGKVLDTLKEYGIQATFFVVYREGAAAEELYKRIVSEGHTLGIHTANHLYDNIYSSVDAYLADFHKVSTHVEAITGVQPNIFRFPGGSLNSYNMEIYQELISEMTRRGYVYYDWNASCGDASGSYISPDKMVQNCISMKQKRKILLMHDGKGNSATAEALPRMIEALREQGYTFKALSNDVAPIRFGYK